MDTVIQDFIKTQKKEWINKNVKKHINEKEKKLLEKKANKEFTLQAWLTKMLIVAEHYYCTHPAKFTHSTPLSKQTKYKAKDLNLIARFQFKPDGYLKSGNAYSEIDFTGYPDNGYSTSLYKFLNLELKNGLTIINNLEKDTDYIRQQLEKNSINYMKIRNILSPEPTGVANSRPYTSGRIKQVYFPAVNDYHLLSIVSPSGLMFRLKKDIDSLNFSEKTKRTRALRRKNEKSTQTFSEIYGLTYIGFGGSNKQNISVLNNQNGGVSYLLPSLPPQLESKKINPPREDFFMKYLYLRHYSEDFEKLHTELQKDRNNTQVRDNIKFLIKSLYYQVIDRSWGVRHLPPEWSDSEHFKALPLSQKIWLDQQYREQRKTNTGWLDEIKESMTRWLNRSYKTVLGEKSLPLADIEFINIKALLDECEEGLK